MDKRPQLSAQNKTDLMPNNASCKRWDTPLFFHALYEGYYPRRGKPMNVTGELTNTTTCKGATFFAPILREPRVQSHSQPCQIGWAAYPTDEARFMPGDTDCSTPRKREETPPCRTRGNLRCFLLEDRPSH